MQKEKPQKVSQKRQHKPANGFMNWKIYLELSFTQKKVGGVELPLFMAAGTLQLLVGSWKGTEKVDGAELPLSTAAETFQLLVGPWQGTDWGSG